MGQRAVLHGNNVWNLCVYVQMNHFFFYACPQTLVILEFEDDFLGGRKNTYGTGENRTLVTLVGGERSQHCAIISPLKCMIIMIILP